MSDALRSTQIARVRAAGLARCIAERGSPRPWRQPPIRAPNFVIASMPPSNRHALQVSSYTYARTIASTAPLWSLALNHKPLLFRARPCARSGVERGRGRLRSSAQPSHDEEAQAKRSAGHGAIVALEGSIEARHHWRKGTMKITGLEANLLLFALDDFLGADDNGKLKSAFEGYSLRSCQALRDRLFAIHEHPREKSSSRKKD